MLGVLRTIMDRATGDARERHRRSLEAAASEAVLVQRVANDLKRREVEALEKLARGAKQ